jgi:hypothetical protein
MKELAIQLGPGITVRSYTSIWLHNSQLINFQYVSCLFYEYLQETVRHLHVLLDIFIIKMTSSLIIQKKDVCRLVS